MSYRVLFILLVALSVSVQGLPAWYSCAGCVPPKCVCASNAAPGGLTPDQTPQFVLLTHDDAVNAYSNKVVRAITDKYKNPNGCNMPATWFTLQTGTDCTIAKTLWSQNHEIALHTINHVPLIPNFNGNLVNEMLGVRTWLNQTCGIPLDDMIGYRNPYLIHNPATRKVVYDAGLLYDSTMIEIFPSESSPAAGQRVFPYTMDNGIPTNCAFTAPDGQCNQQAERYPGVFEVPLYELQDAAGTQLASMDPTGDIYTILKTNFDMNYLGNRAPFGVYTHAPWFTEANTAGLLKFMDYAMKQPNVWAVTTSQLVRWMQNPVPADQMANWLTCNPVDLSQTIGEIKCQLYTVQPGDSAYSIATKFASLSADLLKQNPIIGDGSKLLPGQQLQIPPWDASCVGAAIVDGNAPKAAPVPAAAAPIVSYGEKLPATTAAAPVVAPNTPTVTATPALLPSEVDYKNPQSGLNVTMVLMGRSLSTYQTDLKQPLATTMAVALGLDPKAVVVLSAKSNDPMGRRRLHQTVNGALPAVTVVSRVASGDPVGTYKNATVVFAKGGKYETNTLNLFQISQAQDPTYVVFQNGQVIDPNAVPAAGAAAGSKTTAPSSSSSGLSTGAVVGIIVGVAAGVALLVGGAILYKRKKASKNAAADGDLTPLDTPVEKGSVKFTDSPTSSERYV